MIPRYARYCYCIEKAIEFLISEKVNFFPYDCDDIISEHKWARLKYSILAKQYNVNIPDIIEAYDSEDGYSIYTGTNYTIAYNDTHIPKRIYFTKLHEIGHIILGHFIDFDETILKRSNLSKSSYKVLENEANCFARNVIAPAVIVKALKLDTPNKVSKCFGITHQAAKTRLDLLNNDLKYINVINEQKLLSLFNNFIYKKECLNCGYGFISKTAKYCPICSKKLVRGDGNMVYDDVYELNENGKALKCPRCENEQFADDGVYCKICGTYLINKCTNDNGIYGYNNLNNWCEIKHKCGIIAPSNARFCEYCGEPTTFYTQGLLKDWKTNKTLEEIQKETQEQAACTKYDDIPF